MFGTKPTFGSQLAAGTGLQGRCVLFIKTCTSSSLVCSYGSLLFLECLDQVLDMTSVPLVVRCFDEFNNFINLSVGLTQICLVR